MTRCITEECVHHHGTNPNGTCHAEKVDAAVQNENGWRSVFDFGEAGGSYCWHEPKPRTHQPTLFEEAS